MPDAPPPPSSSPTAANPAPVDLVAELAQVIDLLRPLVGDGKRFRWISEDRRGVYLVILSCLLRRRLAHEIEVHHDDLLDDVASLAEVTSGEAYDTLRFRADLVQLERWGNLTERVEPTRIRSLADRTRSKLLLRLDARTAAFLQFLRAQTTAVGLGVRQQGTNLLRDLLGNVRESLSALRAAKKLLEEEAVAENEPSDTSAARGSPDAPPVVAHQLASHLERASHLVFEADDKAERIADELVRFGDLLARFVAEPFRGESLVALSDWLERYLDSYLTVLDELGQETRTALRRLQSKNLAGSLDAAEHLESKRLAAVPLLAKSSVGFAVAAAPRTVRSVIADLERFFDVHQGLAGLCRRVNTRTRDAIRRIQRHVEAVRLRNVRTETIRARIAELFQLPNDETGLRAAKDFIESLVATVHGPTDGRAGTPEQRAAPPRPRRRYESRRPAFAGLPLQPKRSTPEESFELERRRLDRLSEFIEERVLRGAAHARFAGARIESLGDGQQLVRALATFLLRGGRARRHLRFSLERPVAARRAQIQADELILDIGDFTVQRKRTT